MYSGSASRGSRSIHATRNARPRSSSPCAVSSWASLSVAVRSVGRSPSRSARAAQALEPVDERLGGAVRVELVGLVEIGDRGGVVAELLAEAGAQQQQVDAGAPSTGAVVAVECLADRALRGVELTAGGERRRVIGRPARRPAARARAPCAAPRRPSAAGRGSRSRRPPPRAGAATAGVVVGRALGVARSSAPRARSTARCRGTTSRGDRGSPGRRAPSRVRARACAARRLSRRRPPTSWRGAGERGRALRASRPRAGAPSGPRRSRGLSSSASCRRRGAGSRDRRAR